MPRLPAVMTLRADIRATKVHGQRVADATTFLLSRRADFLAYTDIEDLVVRAEEPPGDTRARALAHHLQIVRVGVVRELWSRQLFIGISVIEELLFQFIRDPTVDDPVKALLEFIRDRQLHRPGLLVFPLHSFGVLGAGLLRPGSGSVRFSVGDLAVTPQTNSLKRTFDVLEAIRSAWGVRKAVPADALQHYRLSRQARWLERNPLLVVRAVNLPGTYYENEVVLLSRISAGSVEGAVGESRWRFESSRPHFSWGRRRGVGHNRCASDRVQGP